MTKIELNLLLKGLREHLVRETHDGECCEAAKRDAQRVVALGGETPSNRPSATSHRLASQEQLDYIRSLLVRRDVANYWRERAEMVLADNHPKFEDARRVLNQLTQMPPLKRRDAVHVSGKERLATPSQFRYARDLMATRVGGDPLRVLDEATLTFAEAREIIEMLKDAPYAKHAGETGEAYPAGEGIYLFQGEFYLVQAAIYGSGRLYCKKLSEERGKFMRVGGMKGKLTQEFKLTQEQAHQELGRLGNVYDRCIICGRTLTDEDSKARRIGSTCWGKVGF